MEDWQVGCGNAAGLCKFSPTRRAGLGLWSDTMFVHWDRTFYSGLFPGLLPGPLLRHIHSEPLLRDGALLRHFQLESEWAFLLGSSFLLPTSLSLNSLLWFISHKSLAMFLFSHTGAWWPLIQSSKQDSFRILKAFTNITILRRLVFFLLWGVTIIIRINQMVSKSVRVKTIELLY